METQGHKQRTPSMISVFIKFMALAFSAHRFYFLAVLLRCVIVPVQALFSASLLAVLIRALESGSFQTAIPVGCGLAVISLVLNAASKWSATLLEVHLEKSKEAISHKIFIKLTKIPYQYLEDPKYLDLVKRAEFSVDNEECMDTLLNASAVILQNVLTLAGLTAILGSFDAGLLLVLVVTAALNAILFQLFSKAKLKFFDKNVVINRKFVYYTDVLLNFNHGKDFRMYKIGAFMQDKFRWFADQMCQDYNAYLKSAAVLQSSMQVVRYVELSLVYGFVAFKTIAEKLAISSFSLYVSTASCVSSSVFQLLNKGMSFYIGLQLVEPLTQLMELKETAELGRCVPLVGGIQTVEFKEVTFSYPKSDSRVLDQVSFQIHKGEKISIVGLNGAGKTTLIKLLCRLYCPDSGDILVNGTSIYDYEYGSYLQEISTLFQDFKLFAFSIKENILNSNAGTDEDVCRIIEAVGLKPTIDTLPDGIHSLYTKFFDEGGVALSGGEGQKLAQARALYSNASLIVLDEPTSALDPLAEAEFYENFNRLVRDKTVVYISHRMSSSLFCDKILLLEGGRVCGFDSHKNLIQKKDSLYYKLFMAQAKQYF